MEQQDIRRSISLQIDKEVRELINVCSVDKLSQRICSNADFWEPIFEEHNLPFSTIRYDNAQVWISTFEKERKLKIYTDRLMEILEHPKFDDFEDFDFDLNPTSVDPGDIGLFVYIDQCPFLEVFNIEEINYNELLLIVNSYIIHKFSEKELDMIPNAVINYFDGVYDLIIYPDAISGNEISFDISRETVKTIFYRILSYGAIPLDTMNSNRVKLVK